MGGLSKGSNTSTQTQSSSTAPDPRAYQAYLDLMNRAGGIADTPWNPNTAQRVAGFTDDQNNAFERIRGGIAQPYINKADQYASAAASPITAENISNYYNPYQNDVIDATMANFDTSNNRQLSGVVGNARTSGSLGGDREAVAKALTSQAQTQAQAPVIAGMRQQGYNTALGAAQQDQQRSLQAAGMMGQLGQLAYTDVNALMQSGGMQQGQTQRGYDAYSQNAAAQSAYPFQTAQWLAGIYGGIGPQMGSTTTSTGTRQGPQPNTWSQAAGIGIAALPYLAALRDGGRVASYGSGGSVVTDRGATVADHMRDITDAARYAAGGGIGYVPQINMPSGGGMQPARMDPMQWGADQRTKDIGDYAKEFGDTSKATGDAFKSIGQIGTNIGNAMRTETGSGGAPNGWGNVTTTFPDSMQNASYGLNNTLSGITSGIGSMFGYADGGGVRGYAGGGAPNWNAPAIPITSDMIRGSYDIPAQYEFEQTPMSRFSGQPPPPPMPQSQDDGLAPITDLPIRDQSVGIVPTSSTGDMYAPPPVNVMNPSSGGVGAIPAAAIPSSQQSAPSSSSGVMGWLDGIRKAIASDESKAALGRMGATMMAESGQGGKGSFGIHAGKGIIAGMDARDAYVKSEREAKINAAKMDLAQRAAAIQEAQEGRAVRAAPYELQMAQAKAKGAEGTEFRAGDMHALDRAYKEAQTKALNAQASAKEDPSAVFRLRELQARGLGLNPESPEFKEYVLTGKMSKQELSATAQKQILESEESLANSGVTKQFLNRAMDLNGKAFSGATASERAWLMSQLPAGLRPEGTMETRELGRVMMTQVLANLKQTFGGNPTEGERKILIDVEAAVNATPEERKGILDRAKQLLETRERLNTRMLSELRGGTMFKPQQPGSSASPPASADPWGIRP